LIGFLVEDIKPVSMVYSDSFREFCHNLNPSFKVPCRQTITKAIRQKAIPVQALLREKIRGRTLSLTTDLWSSDNKEVYLCLTVHWIDDQFILQHGILEFKLVYGSHTKEMLANEIGQVLNDWDVKPVAIVTDSAANMIATVKELIISDVLLILFSLVLLML